MTLSETALCYCAQCHNLFNVMLNVVMLNNVMLSVIYAECHLC
jgi:hypothetical protein